MTLKFPKDVCCPETTVVAKRKKTVRSFIRIIFAKIGRSSDVSRKHTARCRITRGNGWKVGLSSKNGKTACPKRQTVSFVLFQV